MYILWIVSIVVLVLDSSPLSYVFQKRLISLVRAKVINVTATSPNGADATLEIIYVYAGDKEIKGKSFTDRYRKLGGNDATTYMPFQVGEEGLWTVALTSWSPNNPDLKYHPVKDMQMLFSYRCRKSKGGSERFDDVVIAAQMIEKFEKAKPEDRVPLLCDLLKHRTPEVFVWAMRKLGATDTDAARKVLDDLAEKPNLDQSIMWQIILDYVLVERKQKTWHESKIRKAMLQSWVDGKPNDSDAVFILQRFSSASQGNELPNKYFVELTKTAVMNTNWPQKARLSAMRTVGTIAGRSTYEESTYTWLFEYVQNNKDIAFRRAAAGAIYHMKLNPIHIQAVETHLTTEPDKGIVQTLQAAIQAAKEPKKP